MKILLKKDIPGIGRKNGVYEVADGYAHNYLFPNGFALMYDREAQYAKEELEKKRLVEEKKKMELKKKIDSICLEFSMKSHEGKLYGAVHANDIVLALEKQHNLSINKSHVLISKPLKEYGFFTVQVKLSSHIICDLKVKLF